MDGCSMKHCTTTCSNYQIPQLRVGHGYSIAKCDSSYLLRDYFVAVSSRFLFLNAKVKGRLLSERFKSYYLN